MVGWIKLSKEINSHWIWKDPIKFQWWIDILLTVNWSDSKVCIGYKVLECKRGETLLSLLSWAKRWNVSKSVVNNFFTMLETDNMIKTVNETITTRLIVCNYDSYQQTENASGTETKRKRNASRTQHDTIEEYKEEKENKEDIIYSPDVLEIIDSVKEFFNETYLNDSAKKTLTKLLKNYKKDEIIDIIIWARNNSFWASNFLSISKLDTTNADKVKYIDIFKEKMKQSKKPSQSEKPRSNMFLGEMQYEKF